MNRRSVLLGLLCALLALLGSTADAQRHSRSRSRTKHTSGKNPTQLRGKLKSIRQQKEQVRQQLRQTKRQTKAVVEDIHVVDARLERIENELDRTTHRLNDSQSEQRELTLRLGIATKRMEQVRAQVAKRLGDMYMRRHSSSLSALMGTKSMHDLLTRQQVVEAIAKYDHDLFVEYRSLRTEISNRKRRQDRLVADIRDLKTDQVRQHGALESTKVEKREILSNLYQKQDQLKRQLAQWEADEQSIANEIAAFARRARRPGQKPLPQFVGRFLKPANGPITSGFGSRYHPILHYTRPHKGIDIGAPYGSAIYAAADGEVISAHYSTSFGNVIIIAHGGNISTVYAHCSRIMVSSGQTVRRGQQIGAVGATGLAKGPHLHWEVHVGGRAVNPLGRF